MHVPLDPMPKAYSLSFDSTFLLLSGLRLSIGDSRDVRTYIILAEGKINGDKIWTTPIVSDVYGHQIGNTRLKQWESNNVTWTTTNMLCLCHVCVLTSFRGFLACGGMTQKRRLLSLRFLIVPRGASQPKGDKTIK